MKIQRRVPDAPYIAAAGTTVIQAIRIAWTKATRGSQYGTIRNHLPRALPFPEAILPSPEPAYVTHCVTYDERDTFRCIENNMNRGLLTEVLGPYELDHSPTEYWRISDWDIGLLPMGTTLRVDLWWSRGVPWRDPIQGLFNLELGQWACLRFNWRSSGAWWEPNEYDEHIRDATWHYRQLVLNIGLFSNPPQDVFVVTRPNFRHVDMARLR
jgi:hypothetical protein